MTYKIRKRENMMTSEIIELDPNDFRNLEENPYTGDSQEEFLDYIGNLNLEFDSPSEELAYETQDKLSKLGQNVKWTEFGNLAMSGSYTWYELVEEDEGYSRTGGFNISCATEH
jgi:hypothetical protein